MPREYSKNPFEITKAVDFTDQQINDYWVDIAGENFQSTLKPSSSMPMMILGGKGSGKTHLMRYYSFPSQKIRHQDALLEGIVADGYIGIYLRCGGLNGHRFTELGKDKGSVAFSYYMDLWLTEITISTISEIMSLSDIPLEAESEICLEAYSLFSNVPENIDEKLDLKSLRDFILSKQKNIDVAVNNFPFRESLDVDIETTPGKLVFDIPRIFAAKEPKLQNILFSFFLDEFENLEKGQQRYVNTLIREKELPCSFKVGSRLYGVKTLETYSAGEVNKPGSEFEQLHLDTVLRSHEPKVYRDFGRNLFLNRLTTSGLIRQPEKGQKFIDTFFEHYRRDKFYSESLKFIFKKYKNSERPHLLALRQSLVNVRLQDAEISEIINNLEVPKNPLLEKVNLFLLYQDWNANKELLEASREISKQCDNHLKEGRSKRHNNVMEHFGSDLHAQLLREGDMKQQYFGLDTFIDMSNGLPRNLFMLLKQVYQWSNYRSELPFRDSNKISMEAQRNGVKEAADWFYQDAKVAGADVELVRNGMSQLAELFRSIRYSNKPAECSLTCFSVNGNKVSQETKRIFKLATDLSLLVQIQGGQRDKNSERVDDKYQINPMLSPRWDLPISRRGTLALSSNEVNTIFDSKYWYDFDKTLAFRVQRMTAPFTDTPKNNLQTDLFPVDNND